MASNKPRLSSDPDSAPDPTPQHTEGGLGIFALGAPAQDEYTLDLTELPDGAYPAHVSVIDLKVGGSSGQPYFLVTFTLDAPDEHRGHEISTVISFAPQALNWAVRKLSAIAGHALPRQRINLADQAFQEQFIGRPVVLRITAQIDYFGLLTPEVEEILPVRGAPDGNV